MLISSEGIQAFLEGSRKGMGKLKTPLELVWL